MPDAGAPSRDRVGRLAPWIALALAAAGAAIRLLHVPGVVHQENPLGLLRSDPALLYYITARVVEHGGRLPDDFRADPRIEWPEPTDIPATFTVGQELLVAWAYLGYAGLGGELPLHRFALVAMSLLASLTLLGVVGIARELTGSRRWACLAGLVFLCTPGGYRTLGSILVREDLSLPLFGLYHSPPAAFHDCAATSMPATCSSTRPSCGTSGTRRACRPAPRRRHPRALPSGCCTTTRRCTEAFPATGCSTAA